MAHQNRISVAHPENGRMRHRHLVTKIYFCGAHRWCATEMSRFCGALSGVRHRNISVAHKSFRAPQNCMRHRKKTNAPQNNLQVFSICCCMLYKYRYITGNIGISHYRNTGILQETGNTGIYYRKYRYITLLRARDTHHDTYYKS